MSECVRDRKEEKRDSKTSACVCERVRARESLKAEVRKNVFNPL